MYKYQLTAMATKVAMLENMFKQFSLSGGRKKRISRSQKAGLMFPVGKVHRLLRNRLCKRISKYSAVYLTAVLEYLTAEILEMAGNAAKDFRKNRISPRHLFLAFAQDSELDDLTKRFSRKTLSSAGVIPNIHSSLLTLVMDRKTKEKAQKTKKTKSKKSKSK